MFIENEYPQLFPFFKNRSVIDKVSPIKMKNKTLINGPMIDLPMFRPDKKSCFLETSGRSIFNANNEEMISVDSSITAPNDPMMVSAKNNGRGGWVTYCIDS